MGQNEGDRKTPVSLLKFYLGAGGAAVAAGVLVFGGLLQQGVPLPWDIDWDVKGVDQKAEAVAKVWGLAIKPSGD